jgi:hypothetical protein
MLARKQQSNQQTSDLIISNLAPVFIFNVHKHLQDVRSLLTTTGGAAGGNDLYI